MKCRRICDNGVRGELSIDLLSIKIGSKGRVSDSVVPLQRELSKREPKRVSNCRVYDVAHTQRRIRRREWSGIDPELWLELEGKVG